MGSVGWASSVAWLVQAESGWVVVRWWFVCSSLNLQTADCVFLEFNNPGLVMPDINGAHSHFGSKTWSCVYGAWRKTGWGITRVPEQLRSNDESRSSSIRTK